MTEVAIIIALLSGDVKDYIYVIEYYNNARSISDDASGLLVLT